MTVKFSVGVYVANTLAAKEAVGRGQSRIEPEDLFLGLLGLGRAWKKGAAYFQLKETLFAPLIFEKQRLDFILEKIGLVPDEICDSFSKHLPKADFVHDGESKVPRSDETKMIFEISMAQAQEKGLSKLQADQLFHAVLFHENRGIRRFLEKKGTRVDALTQDTPPAVNAKNEKILNIKTSIFLDPVELAGDTMPAVTAHARFLPEINYSLVHAGIPFLESLEVSNPSDREFPGSKLEIVLEGFTKPNIIDLPPIPPRESVEAGPVPPFAFDGPKMKGQLATEHASLEIRIDGSPIQLTGAKPIRMLPRNAWHCTGFHDALAGFVMPQSRAVHELSEEAIPFLTADSGGALKSFADVLESGEQGNCDLAVQAIYKALQQRGIRYEYEPRNYSFDWQLVRLHDDAWHWREATCIDIVLLICACLESVHLDPLIFIVEIDKNLHHALAGCWVCLDPVEEPIIENHSLLQQWILEDHCITMVDPDGFRHGMSFEQCKANAVRYIQSKKLVYALDIASARYDRRIMPMPFGGGMQRDREASLAVCYARKMAEETQSSKLESRHMMLGLLALEWSVLRRVMKEAGSDVSEIEKIAKTAGPSKKKKTRPAFIRKTENWKAIMRLAEKRVEYDNSYMVKEIDLVRAFLEKPGSMKKLFEKHGCVPKRCLEILDSVGEEGLVLSEWRSSFFYGPEK